jgi:hypothetical protein
LIHSRLFASTVAATALVALSLASAPAAGAGAERLATAGGTKCVQRQERWHPAAYWFTVCVQVSGTRVRGYVESVLPPSPYYVAVDLYIANTRGGTAPVADREAAYPAAVKHRTTPTSYVDAAPGHTYVAQLFIGHSRTGDGDNVSSPEIRYR